MKEKILYRLVEVAQKNGIDSATVSLDFPDNIEHGDYSSNVAMVNAKKLKTNPRQLAEKIMAEYVAEKPDFIESVSVAGSGFINFSIKESYLKNEIIDISKSFDDFFKKQSDQNQTQQKIIIEYTDPNTFKAFHIGHLMTNAIGESLSRLIEFSGATVTRMCYTSDIGLHIAKAVWAIKKHLKEMPDDSATIIEKTAFLGKMYVEGTQSYETDTSAKNEIDTLNQVLYQNQDSELTKIYQKGREWSSEHFELLYKILGTKFDKYYYESQMAPIGLKIVKEKIKNGVFEESQGAVVFKGEEYGLHTRVFINSHGLPTYETKEIGLNTTKFEEYPQTTQSIIVTANEQSDYFKVLIKVLTLIDDNIGNKTKHIGHGMLRFSSGKMSSRLGNVITGESLLAEMRDLVANKISGRQFSLSEQEEISNIIAVGAIKYSILRSAIGGDIIFDSAKSISFEGDSGPYLQYSAVRANSIIRKAQDLGINFSAISTDWLNDQTEVANHSSDKQTQSQNSIKLLEKLIIRCPEIIIRARNEFAPQYLANYLMILAGAFNSFYTNQVIIDSKDSQSPYFLALTKVFGQIMTRGLWLLGIQVPAKM